MPVHITAYVYVMAMAIATFALLKKPLTASLMTTEDFNRRRNAWLGVTSAAFLAHNFWVFVFAASVIILLTAQRDRNPPALFMMLLLTVPNFEADVPGFGIVNYLVIVSPARLLSLLILLPMAWRLLQSQSQSQSQTVSAQKWSQGSVIAFTAMMLVTILFSESTVANNVRNFIDLMLLMVVPFYVMTHALRDLKQLREVLACLMLAFALLGVIALFETLRHWLIFESMRGPLGIPPPRVTLYVLRETAGGGALRAMGTTGHPIVLGYAMGVGLCLWVALQRSMRPVVLGFLAACALAVGLLVALSRGPWVATAAGLLALVLAGPNSGKRFVVTSAVLTVGFLGLMATPYGDKVIGYIPFIGTVEKGTVDYRVKLIEVSMAIFWDNPILGDFRSLVDPRLEQMRQGQGIIDMVNTYLGVALQYGAVGVLLFVSPFVIAAVSGFQRARAVERHHESMGITGRALAAAMVVTLVTIATTSSVEYMPMVYWPLLGCAMAYVGIAERWRNAQRTANARPAAAPRSVLAGLDAMAPVAPRGARPTARPGGRLAGRWPRRGDVRGNVVAAQGRDDDPRMSELATRSTGPAVDRNNAPRAEHPTQRPPHRTYPKRS